MSSCLPSPEVEALSILQSSSSNQRFDPFIACISDLYSSVFAPERARPNATPLHRFLISAERRKWTDPEFDLLVLVGAAAGPTTMTLVVVVVALFFVEVAAADAVNIWPLPIESSTSNQTRSLHSSSFHFALLHDDQIFIPNADGDNNTAGPLMSLEEVQLLERAFTRYHRIIFETDPPPSSLLKSPNHEKLVVKVELKEGGGGLGGDVPQLGDDESYTLDTTPGRHYMMLEAETVWGVLRGLETFSQLCSIPSSADDAVATSAEEDPSHTAVDVIEARISDAPRFPHRGLMLDTARHFLPVELILRQIDAMAFNKLNTLHWHLTDSQ